MGFDPVMMAMARPKVIDLTKYIVADYGNFNNAVLHLFSQGGGVVEFADNTTFWKDVDTNRPLQFAIDASVMELAITADVKSRMRTPDGNVCGIETSILTSAEFGWARVTIQFIRSFEGSQIHTAINVMREVLAIS